MLVRRLAVDSLTLGTKMKSRFIDVDCSALIEDFLEGWPEFRPGHGGVVEQTASSRREGAYQKDCS